MLLSAYSIYDVKAAIFHPPFFVTNNAVAERTFSNVALDPGTSVGQHPEDYILFRVGTWDDSTGRIESVIPPEHVTSAAQLVYARGQQQAEFGFGSSAEG